MSTPIDPHDSAWEALFAPMCHEEENVLATLTDEECQFVARSMPLLTFYDTYLKGYRRQQVADDELSARTLEKELLTLQKYSAWDAQQKPDNWPASTEWPGGVPIGFVRGPYLETFIDSLRDGRSIHTVRSFWTHIRTLFGFALKMKVLQRRPTVKPIAAADDNYLDGDLFATTFTVPEIGRIYDQLDDEPPLQIAFVLAVNAGCRPSDLFALTWEQFHLDRQMPMFVYRPKKTRRHIRLKIVTPLAPITVQHILRLQELPTFQPGGQLFPTLSGGTVATPEHTKPARRRNALFKQAIALANAGDQHKPWQVCRATCNTRLNNVPEKRGAGRLMLHPPKNINSLHYDNPLEWLYEAVCGVQQPEQFSRIPSVAEMCLPRRHRRADWSFQLSDGHYCAGTAVWRKRKLRMSNRLITLLQSLVAAGDRGMDSEEVRREVFFDAPDIDPKTVRTTVWRLRALLIRGMHLPKGWNPIPWENERWLLRLPK